MFHSLPLPSSFILLEISSYDSLPPHSETTYFSETTPYGRPKGIIYGNLLSFVRRTSSNHLHLSIIIALEFLNVTFQDVFTVKKKKWFFYFGQSNNYRGQRTVKLTVVAVTCILDSEPKEYWTK
jgi:hypothetical protein